jgi:Dolichyl-phosphate-mannose-protein mannosyltransferase
LRPQVACPSLRVARRRGVDGRPEALLVIFLHVTKFRRFSQKSEWACFILLVAAASTAAALLASNRLYITFGTETDYLGVFMPEADRLLNGEPLRLRFHPPLYLIVLASVHSVTGDWVATGLAVSWVSGTVVIVASYLLFRAMGLPHAGWGALFGLITSPVFLLYWAQAGSDVFYLSLWTLALLLTVVAYRRQDPWLWTIVGLFVGLVVLVRSAGITAPLLLTVPGLQRLPWRTRVFHSGVCAMSFVLVVSLWFVAAKITRSPFFPSGNEVNLAMTYFAPGDDRTSGDALSAVGQRFTSVWQVLTYDPARMAHVYVLDAYGALRQVFASDAVVALPLSLLALPGFMFLPFRHVPLLGLVFLLAMAQAILVNFKAFEARYFLFAVPVLGAGAFGCLRIALTQLRSERLRYSAVLLLSGVLLISSVATIRQVRDQLHLQDVELGEALLAARKHVSSGNTIVSRKPHLAYYLQAADVRFPEVANADELRAHLKAQEKHGASTFLYFGSEERQRRAAFGRLAFPEQNQIPWLTAVAWSRNPGDWVLYRVDSR